MTDLHFPNSSRSIDMRHNRVCFWGYHDGNGVCFLVGIDVLQRISKKSVIAESDMLNIFDGALNKIHQVANRVYEVASKDEGTSVFDLTAENF